MDAVNKHNENPTTIYLLHVSSLRRLNLLVRLLEIAHQQIDDGVFAIDLALVILRQYFEVALEALEFGGAHELPPIVDHLHVVDLAVGQLGHLQFLRSERNHGETKEWTNK
jgi:hypothetical protein